MALAPAALARRRAARALRAVEASAGPVCLMAFGRGPGVPFAVGAASLLRVRAAVSGALPRSATVHVYDDGVLPYTHSAVFSGSDGYVWLVVSWGP